MKKTLIAAAIFGAGLVGSAQAASFLNGGFESGDYTGWNRFSGSISYGTPTGTSTGDLALNPASFTTNSNWQGAITTAGATDSISGKSTVKYGNNAVRVNNNDNDYSVNIISQSVSNYDGNSINFAWAAVLQSSHGLDDSDIFGLKITDTTSSTVLYNTTYSSASAPGLFTYSNGWYYNDWMEISLNVTQGHDFKVELLAADCSYGGHAGYVYLDGFGTVQGGGGDNGTGGGGNSVPEPGSMALAGIALMGLFGIRRRKSA